MKWAKGWSAAFTSSQGWLDLNMPDAMETAQIDLTQVALGARFGNGPFSLAASVSYGFGSVDSTSSLIAVSTASRTMSTSSACSPKRATRSRPAAGGCAARHDGPCPHRQRGLHRQRHARLAVPSHDSDRTRLIPGLEFGRSFPLGDRGALDLSGSVPYVAIVGGEERTLPVAFTIAPGTPLVMRGLSERDSALIGAQARLRLSPTFDLYLAYDGRFAGGYDAHGGTVGFKLVW